ncbi:MAG: o-succinylbenzoate synthase [Oscillatoria sp. Prado101]|jgi:O-succinylbenzoate synthase|nr:o-succinylbenzoate synthase [Oscillatoria sp. Prado101]
MLYRFEFRPYRRPFQRPLQTSHGTWVFREGIIIRLTGSAGQVGFGEIAPLSWFGSETFEQALDFCQGMPAEIPEATIFSIPPALPACQFAFESAWETLTGNPPIPKSRHPTLNPLTYSALLPAGEAALSAWQPLWQQGYRTFKWKIAVAPAPEELQIFHRLTQTLPAPAKLRLDANGGLGWEDASQWLQACDSCGAVEYLEQPLPVDRFDAMLELSNRYSTHLALDESVATLAQIQDCFLKGWRGIFVIKPAIAGSPSQLRRFCREHNIDVVFSSVFETAIGFQAALRLSAELSRHNRAAGFGVSHWFGEDDQIWLENLWQAY